jgi:NitT/TauT family transport system substrate-binding protein
LCCNSNGCRKRSLPATTLQVYQRSGLGLTCRKDSGIRTPADFKGKTLGVWYAGNQYPFLAWMSKLNYKTTGGREGVTVLRQDFTVEPLLRKQAACISTMSYNEYWQVIESGMTADQLVVFKYQDEGVAMLEDGLYTTEARLMLAEVTALIGAGDLDLGYLDPAAAERTVVVLLAGSSEPVITHKPTGTWSTHAVWERAFPR